MSKCDEYFIRLCTEILESGTSTEGEKVRPHWDDGELAYTIKKFGQVFRYDLKRESPVLTLRPVPVKNAFDELLWIWQRKSNAVKDLGSKIWDAWTDEKGTIGRAYGYQLARKYPCPDVRLEGIQNAFPDYESRDTDVPESVKQEVFDPKTGRVAAALCDDGLWRMDQVDKIIYDLKNTPFSRRIMASMWNPEELYAMRLYPCAYSMTFNVTTNPKTGALVLNGILNQRSQDILTAFAWNEYQYGVGLMYCLAQVCNMEVGEFVHVIADAHIYDRHVELVKELCAREPQPEPEIWINPDVHDFYAFTPDDIKLHNYQTGGPQIKNIPVAV